MPQHALSLHMVFNGNPGTGKTTVARIVGRIFKALGLLKKGHLIETDRSGLVAEYAGQTATKTNRKIDEALDGILFVDEAYSLVATDGADAYGLEAIQALVKRMEDDRQRLVVILAGYPGPMQQLLDSNPGLSSRFNTQMMFTDYEPVDLGRIYQLMCEANHYQLPPEARAKLLLGFHWLYRSRDEHFGNGRLVRNTFENSVRRLADRIADIVPITRELLTKLTTHDIYMADVPDEIWQQAGEDRTFFAVPCPHCAQNVHLRSATRFPCALPALPGPLRRRLGRAGAQVALTHRLARRYLAPIKKQLPDQPPPEPPEATGFPHFGPRKNMQTSTHTFSGR